jgi:predicted small lipoprotein YifL
MRRLLATLAAAAMLAGCGLKGPLYLPEDKPDAKQTTKPSRTPQPPATGRPL